uniref:Integrase core domain containing protein n=1 Tax=Solanum tuberosum TaxID=4113 RepID=M1DBP6_SOLTU
MATLLQHVRPWMKRDIAEYEARVEQQMEHMMDQQVQAVHQCLDAFKLRVLERTSPTIDRVRKRERQQIEVSRRASIVYEEMRQQRAREIGMGPSSGVSTTDGAVRVDESTTEGAGIVDGNTINGIPSVDLAGSGKPDPPAS